jgi:fatty acid desaturase
MEILAALVCYYYGDSRLGWWITVVLLATSQIQAGWLQHDFGHLSVFTNLKMNELAHKFVIMALKGASMKWWKARHNRHHAKTNVLKKDPDIEVAPLFLFSGMVKANKGWKYTPFQQHYWWILGPPTVTTLLFFFQNAKFVFSKNLKNEIAWGLTFFVRFFLTYTLIAGFWSQLGLYWAMRFLESLWFTWVTSMNHLTMPIEPEDNKDWVNLQMRTTQNVEHSAFNDWFTGHLNFQCEHHLFPTMPRHNYPKVHARVVELCKKHGVPVRVRPLITAFNDILVALSKSSSEWGTSVKKLQ